MQDGTELVAIEKVRNRDNSERIVYRKNGLFAKREQPDLSLEQIQSATIALLTDDTNGKKSLYELGLENPQGSPKTGQ